MAFDIEETLLGLQAEGLVPNARGERLWRMFLQSVADELACEEGRSQQPVSVPRDAPGWRGPGQSTEASVPDCSFFFSISKQLAWEVWKEIPEAVRSILIDQRGPTYVEEFYVSSDKDTRRLMRERFATDYNPSARLSKAMEADRRNT